MTGIYEEAHELLLELAAEAKTSGASSWYVDAMAKKLADLRNPASIVDARRLQGAIEGITAVTLGRSPRFDELLRQLEELILPIDAVWRLSGGS